MKDSKFNYLELKGVTISYLGSLKSDKVLLFLGRNNSHKNSIPLQELLNRLILDGYLLVWTKERTQLISEFLEEKSKKVVSFLDRIHGPQERPIKVWTLRFVRGLILIFHPSKWNYFIHWVFVRQINGQNQVIRKVIQTLGENKSIFILSNSAGGITASALANLPTINGIICFGYPFKHPDKGEEGYRTNCLKDIQKPFLIIQGANDEYGGKEVPHRYVLSPCIEFEFVEATHEYENLSADDWARVTHKIETLLQTK